MKIAFLTPYKHLPKFKKYVEKKYTCIEVKSKEEVTKDVVYLFVAPNYLNYKITEDFIKGMNLRGIISPSTGTNHIEVKSIPIIDIKGEEILDKITSTAEHNLFLCLSIMRQIGTIDELSTKTLGVLGWGRLGKMVDLIGTNIFKDIKINDDTFIDDDFFNKTDFLSINITLEDRNINLVNKDYINKFKKNIFIINTARGEVVDEEDIIDLINKGKVLGYATDVIKEEHSSKATLLKLISDPRILITPHIGGTAISAQEKAYKRVIKKLKSL
jgi:lactate dehydrogenase-like 2-hydroxyacid dehydrogenase|tara:strand:+ start:11027 stop:11842 length:816 start_codon:yes stop_codon:yes gene_type:complete